MPALLVFDNRAKRLGTHRFENESRWRWFRTGAVRRFGDDDSEPLAREKPVDFTDASGNDPAPMQAPLTIRYDNLFTTAFLDTMGFHQQADDGKSHPEWHFHATFSAAFVPATVQSSWLVMKCLAILSVDITAESAAVHGAVSTKFIFLIEFEQSRQSVRLSGASLSSSSATPPGISTSGCMDPGGTPGLMA